MSMATRMLLSRVVCRTATTKSLTTTSSSSSSQTFATAVRKQVSKEERAALRAARREQAAQRIQQIQGVEGDSAAAVAASGGKQFLQSRYIWYLSVAVPTLLIGWGLSDEDSPPAQLSEMIGLTSLIKGFTDEIAKPSHDKLLPDWSQMPNVPHDIPVPHTLVLDLESTLVSSTWDRKYGWRHAKRPGVDKFLMDMAQYYEIVLYSPSIDAIADPVVNSLDKSGCIMHRLYRDATYYTNGIHVKDLNRLNRPLNRMIVLDDDPEEVSMNPENLIRVKPYTDPNDRDDNTLERITPFLVEIAREGYSNIPELLLQYQGMDADGIADEQERRIRGIQQSREERLSRGLGGLAMASRRSMEMEPELEPSPQGQSFTPSLTSKDLVGAAPPSATSNSGIMGFLNRRQQEKEENDRRKFEKWNEVMMKKQREKQQKAS